MNDNLLAERNQTKPAGGKGGAEDAVTPPEPTWVHEIFQGILTSETRCLNCETVSSKDEDFFDLQVDVDQNTSITHCLKCFSNTETLCGDNKFKCDNCSSYQEAQVIYTLSTILIFVSFPFIFIFNTILSLLLFLMLITHDSQL